MLTNFFLLLILSTTIKSYEFDISVIGKMKKFSSYAVLEVKLDL